MKKMIREKWLSLMNFLLFQFGRIIQKRYQMLWLIGLLSAGVAVFVMIITAPSESPWLFIAWGLASGGLVVYSSGKF
jgi:hypothetical protein